MSEHIEPGIHDLTAERYQDAEGCSASMLDVLARSTPMHLRCWLNGERTTEETPALRFGILCHYAILQGDLYKERFHIRPEGLKLTTKEGKKWKEDHADKPDITFDDSLQIMGMVDSVRRHRFAARLLYNGQPERSLFVYDAYGTLRKSRLDILTAGTVLADIKTCLSANTEDFERTISRRRYHARAAYYLDNCNLMNLDKSHYFFICVEKMPPYAVRCLQLEGTVIEWGRKCYNADLQIYRNCIESGQWPGYEDTYAEVSLPSWEMRQILELI